MITPHQKWQPACVPWPMPCVPDFWSPSVVLHYRCCHVLQVASAPKEQAGSRPWMGNLFGTFGSSATAARQPNRSQSAGLAFRDIIAGVQGAPQPMSSRITLSMEALARR